MTRNGTITAALAFIAVAACQDGTNATNPDLLTQNSPSAERGRARTAEVRIEDKCDPKTFADVPGGCQRKGKGGIKLDQFLKELTKHHTVKQWAFKPRDLKLRLGDSFVAENHGGEMHTFTEVDEFGGGIVPQLNELSGNTKVAPECQTLGAGAMLSPGDKTPPDTPDEVGDEHYQCCIHPWMRMTVHVKAR